MLGDASKTANEFGQFAETYRAELLKQTARILQKLNALLIWPVFFPMTQILYPMLQDFMNGSRKLSQMMGLKTKYYYIGSFLWHFILIR